MCDAEHGAVGRPTRALVQTTAVLVVLELGGCVDALPGFRRPHFQRVVLAHGYDVLRSQRVRIALRRPEDPMTRS